MGCSLKDMKIPNHTKCFTKQLVASSGAQEQPGKFDRSSNKPTTVCNAPTTNGNASIGSSGQFTPDATTDATNINIVSHQLL